MARHHPLPDRPRSEQQALLAAHFVELWDLGFARALDAHWIEGRLANVRIRGVAYSPADEGLPSTLEECVWSFSLRHDEEGWRIRNWSMAWPSTGSAPRLDASEKPWISEFADGLD